MVVGVGALNLDLIASASKLSTRMAEEVVESTARFEWNVEGTVEEEVIHRVLGRLGSSSIDGSLGGSAWNTVYSLAQMRIGVSVGYVGIAGRTEFPGLSFVRQMERLGIDSRYVRRVSDRRCGLCLSYVEDGERVLLTHAGANLAMGAFITEKFTDLVEYLAGARAIHVTSFLDSDSTERAVELLLAVKRASPETILSVDPGHVWVSNLTSHVRSLLVAADYIFANHREFKMLGHYEPGEVDQVIGSRVIDQFPKATVIVTKRYDLIEIFRGRDSPRVVVSGPSGHERPTERDIEDATGAGDTFAAAVLGALTSPKLQSGLGSLVGLALSRYKLAGNTITMNTLEPSLEQGFLLFPHLTNVGASAPSGVLLAHGAPDEWSRVLSFLTGNCGLRVHRFDAESIETDDVTSMGRATDECGFAVCILSRHDTRRSRVTNQRVIQHAGAFHGRYGFGRVALLVEEGCEVLSNVAGLIRLDFQTGHIDSTFIQLEQMLRREGMLTKPASRARLGQ
jgi:sugar/nucleoside kinase (ribokinase family)